MCYTAQPLYSALILGCVCSIAVFRLQSWVIPVADSLPPGGLDFITDGESICKQQKSPHIAFTHGMWTPRWDCRLKQMHVRRDTWIISVYKMHVNVSIFFSPFPGFTAEMEASGLLSFWKNMKQLWACDGPLLSSYCGPKKRLQLT